ncbi:MAG TPA: hypothetical protein VHN74_20260 [Candidatus Angelobacter sp.]|jgi:hypothetical protein|nr:hypothetical protein [Candidatus Angelobacter sp.]
MADEKKNQHLDAMLDEMLAGYSAVEPRPGFEQRLVATLRDAKPERRWYEMSVFVWAMVAAAAVLLIASGFLFWPRAVSGPQQANKIQQPTESIPAGREESPGPGQSAENSAAHHKVIYRARPRIAKAAVPKLGSFPESAPLSDQERLLLSYVGRTPPQELIAQSRPDEPMKFDGEEALPDNDQNSNSRRNRR